MIQHVKAIMINNTSKTIYKGITLLDIRTLNDKMERCSTIKLFIWPMPTPIFYAEASMKPCFTNHYICQVTCN